MIPYIKIPPATEEGWCSWNCPFAYDDEDEGRCCAVGLGVLLMTTSACAVLALGVRLVRIS